jgi:dipeptidyl aminopeptidase/acylaminoacyl peptidase
VIVVVVIVAIALFFSRHHDSTNAVVPTRSTIVANHGEIAWDNGSGDRLQFVNADGSDLRNVGPPQRGWGGGSFAWSPDGRQLAYLAGGFKAAGPPKFTLYLVGASGQHPRRLTACGDCQGVSWSPDGSQIAVVRVMGRLAPAASNVWVVNAKTGAMRQITQCRVGGCADFEFMPQLQWSPNAGEVLFVGRRTGNLVSLDTIRPDGSHPTTPTTITKITFPEEGGCCDAAYPDPQWSPDGRDIAFDEHNGIYIINADGTGVRRLVANGAYPAWSPNGSRLVYATFGNKWRGHVKLWTINADGSDNRLLYRCPPPNSDQHSFWAVHAWSPHGKQIAFSTTDPALSQTGTYVANADGTDLHRIGPTSLELAWQPTR